jgi:hypothetical protein
MGWGQIANKQRIMGTSKRRYPYSKLCRQATGGAAKVDFFATLRLLQLGQLTLSKGFGALHHPGISHLL